MLNKDILETKEILKNFEELFEKVGGRVEEGKIDLELLNLMVEMEAENKLTELRALNEKLE